VPARRRLRPPVSAPWRGHIPSAFPFPARVQNGYVSSGTGGHARPPLDRGNRLFSKESVPGCAREWTRFPHSSFPRNEGVPGLSLDVGFRRFKGRLRAAAAFETAEKFLVYTFLV